MAPSSTPSVAQSKPVGKADHYYTRNPPSHHSTTKASLAEYRTSTLLGPGPHPGTGVVLPGHGTDMDALAAARQHKMLRELKTLSAKLPPGGAIGPSCGGPRELTLE